MNSILDRLLDCQAITPLSYFFAQFIAEKYQLKIDAPVVLSAALVSQRNQLGHVCIELNQMTHLPLFETADDIQINTPFSADPEYWVTTLKNEKCVGQPGDFTPLILDGYRLYLKRYWDYEEQVRSAIQLRLANQYTQPDEPLKAALFELFPQSLNEGLIDGQMFAVLLAVSRRFAVISGGPGTGKTTSVVKVLALLLQQQPNMHIRLAAPTGKAAARLLDSIRTLKATLKLDKNILARIPDQATTLHRLLGFDGRQFRHSHENPLILDCIVIDEASMIDLPLMARLLAALPDSVRVILLGDRDQLSSVEAGNVLGDITGHGHPVCYSSQWLDYVERFTGLKSTGLVAANNATPISNSIALLKTSFRFDDKGGIGKLAKLINTGNGEQALAWLQECNSDQIDWIEFEQGSLQKTAVARSIEEFSHYLQCTEISQALTKFDRFRILCTTNIGELGIEQINQRIANRLKTAHLIVNANEFHGKPILITENDYELELYNGDIGLLWNNDQGELRAWFRQSDNRLRNIPVRSLPNHSPAWAMTIHKSQGSEFQQVLIVLPEHENHPGLSRELLYTGITRAREKVILHGSSRVFLQACSRRVQRSSGLAEKLGWGCGFGDFDSGYDI